MKKILFIISLAIFSIFAFGLSQANAQPILVDLELVLAVDVSSSVDDDEFTLIKQGYSNAFNPNPGTGHNTDIVNLIQSGNYGSIAVSLFLFSETSSQLVNPSTQGNWFLINDESSATAFSTAIDGLTLPSWMDIGSATWISDAIDHGTGLFGSEYVGTRQIIDISGDGKDDTTSTELATARADALSAGVDDINGIVIDEDGTLLPYFQGNVIAGANPFAVSVSDYNGFTTAIDDKIEREIPPPVPEPLSLMLLGSGLLGMLGLRRKK